MIDEIGVKDNKMQNSSADLVKLFADKKKIVGTIAMDFYREDDTLMIVVSIRLRFWYRLWSVLNNRYRDKLYAAYSQECELVIPDKLVSVLVILSI